MARAVVQSRLLAQQYFDLIGFPRLSEKAHKVYKEFFYRNALKQFPQPSVYQCIGMQRWGVNASSLSSPVSSNMMPDLLSGFLDNLTHLTRHQRWLDPNYEGLNTSFRQVADQIHSDLYWVTREQSAIVLQG